MKITLTGQAAYLDLARPKDRAQDGQPPRYNYSVALVMTPEENTRFLTFCASVYKDALGSQGPAKCNADAATGKLSKPAGAVYIKREQVQGKDLYALGCNSRGYSTESEAVADALMYQSTSGPVRAVFFRKPDGKLRAATSKEINDLRPGARVSAQVDVWLNKKQKDKPIFTLVGVVVEDTSEVWSAGSSFESDEEIEVSAEASDDAIPF